MIIIEANITRRRHMIAQSQGGSVVFIASVAGQIVLYPQPQVAYNVSKAGVLHMTKCFAAEWARYGIRVNSISPGYMDTILNSGDGLAAAKKMWFDRMPLGRMGTPDELVGAIILLCSRYGGRYITGENITVDGEFLDIRGDKKKPTYFLHLQAD
jgi:sorbose reductase